LGIVVIKCANHYVYMTCVRAGTQGGAGAREAGSKIGWYSLGFVSSY